MFRGPSKVTLDAKGRLAIPSRYREEIVTRADGHLVVTVDRDFCLLIYPLPEWEEIERDLNGLPTLDKTGRKLQRLMLGYATEVEMDNQGRVLLSRELREFAKLDRQAMLVGQGNKFELWDEQRWNEQRDKWLAEEEEGESLSEQLASLRF
jgi:MraZ protein